MRPIRIPTLDLEQLDALEKLHRTTREARLGTRAQTVLLAAERHLAAAQVAGAVRASEGTARRWLKRCLAEGVEGVEGPRDEPRPGAPRKVTQEYCEGLIHAARRRPRSPGLPFPLWTLQRLADCMAGRTGLRATYETARMHLKAAGIVPGRPQHAITSPDPEHAPKKRRSKRPATASAREATSTAPTSSTRAGCRHSRRCGGRGAGGS